MSLLNVFVSPDRVLIGVDTYALSPHGLGGYEISKLIPLVHANAIVAGRGLNTFLIEVFAGCFLLPRADFDQIDIRLCQRVDDVWQSVEAAAVHGGLAPDALGACDLVVAGWSSSMSTMSAVHYARRPGEHGFGRSEIRGRFIAPAVAMRGCDPASATDAFALMRSIAQAQVRGVLGSQSEQPIGGRLLIAELDRHRFDIRDAGRLG